MPHTFFNLDTLKKALAKRAEIVIANAEIILIRLADAYINRYINTLLARCPAPKLINNILRGKDNIERRLDSIDRKLRGIRRLARTAKTLTIAIAILIDVLTHLDFRLMITKKRKWMRNQARLINMLIDVVLAVEKSAKIILLVTGNVKNTLDGIRARLGIIDRLCGHCILNPTADLKQNARVINPFLLDPNDLQGRQLLNAAFKRPGNTTLEEDMLQDLRDRQLVLDEGGPFNLPDGSILDPIITENDEGLGLTPEELQEAIEGTPMGKVEDNTVTSENHRSPRGVLYKLKIQTDPDSPEVAPRRRAIAEDARGIVVLTGPYSFASSTKVLKEEVRLRIDNQLP